MHLVSQRRRSVNRLEQRRPSCRCTRNSTHVSDYNRNSSIENGQINQWTHTLNTYFNAFNTNCIDALSIRCCVTCESDSYSWAKFLNWKRANGSGDRWLEGNECGLMGHELCQWDALGLFVALPMNNKLFVTDMRSMWKMQIDSTFSLVVFFLDVENAMDATAYVVVALMCCVWQANNILHEDACWWFHHRKCLFSESNLQAACLTEFYNQHYRMPWRTSIKKYYTLF